MKLTLYKTQQPDHAEHTKENIEAREDIDLTRLH
jgi:hypothetical protein